MATEVLAAQHPPPRTPQSLSRESRRAPLSATSGQQLSQPTSQDSIASVYSSEASEAYSLQTSLSNGSHHTVNTDNTSVSDMPQDVLKLSTIQRRAHTPEEVTSPMSVTSPAFNGTKRTASGHVKNAASVSSTPYVATTPGRVRAESMSSTGSRVGELAASLKMRLGYAMTKVQHGWEHKTIGELERLTTAKPLKRHSMSQHEYSRPRTAVPLQSQYHAPDSTVSPPSKRRSGMFGTAAIIQQIDAPPRLQPAAPIHSHAHSRSADLRSMPMADSYAFAMSPPQTPSTHFPRRPQTIRTDTQTAEAERDALQALTQLGSPHNSQYSRHHNTSQGSSSQASPMMTDFHQGRRVSFARGDSDSSAAASLSDDAQHPNGQPQPQRHDMI